MLLEWTGRRRRSIGASLDALRLEERTTPALFNAGTVFGSKLDNVGCVASGDFNADGFVDLVMTNYGDNDLSTPSTNSGRLTLFLGNGNGTFQNPSQLTAFGSNNIAAFVEVADVDADGDLDIAASGIDVGSQAGQYIVYLNDGVGNFSSTPGAQSTGGQRANCIRVADMNADGNPDLIVANTGSDDGSGQNVIGSNVTIFNGAKATPGVFVAGTIINPGISFISTAIVVGLFNNDTSPDIVATVPGVPTDTNSPQPEGTIEVFFNNGAGGFSSVSNQSIGSGGSLPVNISAGDLTGDGKLDLVVSNAGDASNFPFATFANNNIATFLNTGNGTFGAANTITTNIRIPFAAEIKDFDANGKGDLAVANYNFIDILTPSNGTVAVLLGDNSGKAFAPAVGSPYDVASEGTQYLTVNDFDENGSPDIVAAGFGNQARAFLNTTSAATPIISGTPPATGTVGTAYNFTFTSTGNPTPMFSLTGNPLPGGLTLNTTTGAITGTPTTAGAFSGIIVTASNSAGAASTPAFTITISAGSTPPAFGNGPPPNGVVGGAYTFTYSVSGSPAPTLSLLSGALPTGLTLVGNTLSGTPSAAGTFTGTVRASNTAGNADQPFSIVISTGSTAPVFTNGPPPNGTVGSAYSFTYTASGSPTPTFSLISGGLPTGLTFSNGVLSGTPSAAGTFTGTVRASNTAGNADQAFSIVISSTSTPPTITGTPPNGTVGAGYTFTFTSTGTPPPSFSLFSGSLPPGLSLNPTTGTLSGTPTAAGTFSSIVIQANNTAGTAQTAAFDLTIAAGTSGPSFTNGPPPADGVVGQSYAFAYTFTGGPSPTFSVISGSLPTGLTLSSTGVISGTPTTMGVFSGTVQASNVAGSVNQNFVITISTSAVAPTITNGPPPASATVGAAYTFAYTFTGTPSPVFTVGSGSLPSGLTLSSTGILSGTPSVVGTFTAVVQAANSAGTATQNVSITVVAAPFAPTIISAVPPSTGQVGLSYTHIVTANGNPIPALSAVGLPPGLTFDSATGVVSGTPTQAGTFSGSFSAANGVAPNATQNFTITIVAQPNAPTITSGAPPAGVVDTAYTFTFTAIGTAPITFAATGLPPGLTLASNGTLSGTPLTAGSFTGTVTVSNGINPNATQNFTITVTGGTVLPTTDPGIRTLSVTGATNGSAIFSTFANGQIVPTSPFTPFPGVAGVPRATAADVNGDGSADRIYAAGPGGGDLVRVIDGTSGKDLLTSGTFSAYAGEEFTQIGLFVVAGDIDGDGVAEIVVSPDQGGGARIQVFNIVNGQMVQKANFFGIQDPAFRGGGRIALGDVNGDGFQEVIVGAGFGGGPRIAIFSGKGLTSFGSAGNPPKLVGDFIVFEPGLRNGTWVSAGDLTGDGKADVIFGGGPGGGPRVFAIDGAILSVAGSDVAKNAPIANFFAGDTEQRGGIHVTAKDVDNDAKLDLIVGSGEGFPSSVTTYLGKNIQAQGTPPAQQTFDPYGSATLALGIFVG